MCVWWWWGRVYVGCVWGGMGGCDKCDECVCMCVCVGGGGIGGRARGCGGGGGGCTGLHGVARGCTGVHGCMGIEGCTGTGAGVGVCKGTADWGLNGLLPGVYLGCWLGLHGLLVECASGRVAAAAAAHLELQSRRGGAWQLAR